MSSPPHPLQSYGPITISNIQEEKLFDNGPTDDTTVTTLYGLDGNPIVADRYDWNQYSPPHVQLEESGDAGSNYVISDWYSYNHLTKGTGTDTHLTVTSVLYQLSEYAERVSAVNPHNVYNVLKKTMSYSRKNTIGLGEADRVTYGFANSTRVILPDVDVNIFVVGYQTQRLCAKFELEFFGLVSTDVISGVQIKFTSSAMATNYTGGNLVLTHYVRDSTHGVSTDHWADSSNVNIISDIVAHNNTELVFTLNSYGISLLKEYMSSSYGFIVCVNEFNYDYSIVPYLGTNLLSGNDATLDAASNWIKATSSTHDDQIFTSGGYSDSGRSGLRMVGGHIGESMGAWIDDSYFSTPVVADDALFIFFWHKWIDPPAIAFDFFQTHVHLDSQYYGCGIAEESVHGDWFHGFVDTWRPTGRVEKVDANVTGGVWIYLTEYNHSSGSGGQSERLELLLDDINISKNGIHGIGSGTLSNARLIITKNVPQLPTVTTTAITVYTGTTANAGGECTATNGSDIQETGVCWGTSTNPTKGVSNYIICGIALGTFSATITGLTNGVTYHVRAYAINSVGTAYGNDVTVTTWNIPTVTTMSVTNVVSYYTGGADGESLNAFAVGLTIIGNGGNTITQSGIIRSITNSTPTLESFQGLYNNFPDPLHSPWYTHREGVGLYNSYPTAYLRAFATNAAGTGYGNVVSFIKNISSLPTITTTDISSITNTTASSGGTITSDGGASVTARGVCWSTSVNPTTSDSKTTNGTGTGSFSSSLSGLSAGTLYYCRAYATNSTGTNYGDNKYFTTTSSSAGVTTTTITSITKTTASSGGNTITDGGSAITVKGVCWNTVTAPTTANNKTTDSSGTGTFTSSITGLTAGNTYYVRAYITNGVSTYYGNELTFTALPDDPQVTTTAISNIGTTNGTSGGTNIIPMFGGTIIDRGICWNTSTNPIITDYHNHEGTGSNDFTSTMTGLTSNTTYYVRAFVQNENLTYIYGNVVSFTTVNTGVPGIEIYNNATSTNTSMTLNGNMYSNGGGTITTRGFCWSSTGTPTTADSKQTVSGTAIGNITATVSGGLVAGTVYQIRAYATNEYGTGYSNFITVQIKSAPSGITISHNATILATSAPMIVGIASDGGSTITAKGLVWGTVNTGGRPNLTSDSYTNEGTGVAGFNSTATPLTPSTNYYIKGYAINTYGTTYSSLGNFQTPGTGTRIGSLSEITNAYYNTTTTRFCGCAIYDEGSPVQTEVGICWSTSVNPTIAGNHNIGYAYLDLTVEGTAGSEANPLVIGTTYHFRMYITNSVGTAYSPDYVYIHTSRPSITTQAVSGITGSSTVTGNGTVTTDNGLTVTNRGFYIGTSSGFINTNPGIQYPATTGGTGAFTASITGLSVGVTYYVVSYAVNSDGITYGNEISFGNTT